MSVEIRIGDCRALLAAMPDESVDCVVTSPPYWGLRDYGVVGQIGMEPTLAEHLQIMVEVFRDVKRVLKKSGTCWVNYGDCYATAPSGRSAADTKAAGNDDRTFRDKPFNTIGPIGGKRITSGEDREDVDVGGWGKNDQGLRWRGGGYLKPKDLCMMPNRLAIALQDDGWWVRSEIIWHKPNPMPESIKDRPACSHEKVWLLSKSERYYYDHIAVRVPLAAASYSRLAQDIENQEGSHRANGGNKTNGTMKAARFGGNKGGGDHGSAARRASGRAWEPGDETANLKNVWTIPTAAFSEAHFATFPPSLVEPCIKAGSSEKGNCPDCGSPWKRETISKFIPQDDVSIENGVRGAGDQKPMDDSNSWEGYPRGTTAVETVGWKQSCDCAAHLPTPSIVLDPFGGAGTVALVADRLGRNPILFELNPEYAAIAERRIRDDAGMFTDVFVKR